MDIKLRNCFYEIYYQRKVAAGKNKMSVMSSMRNKLGIAIN